MLGDNSGPQADTDATPVEAFALVGHEIRAEIIRVLGDPDEGGILAFSKLRSRLDTDVEPSQLYYHLQQLLDHFIRKTDDGYHLRPAGVHLYWALRTGAFGRRQDVIMVDTGTDCHYCQAPVKAAFDNGYVSIVCDECECCYIQELLDFPLEAFDDGAKAFEHFGNYMVSKTLFLANGVCPSCAYPLRPAIHPAEGPPISVCIHPSCDFCGAEWDLSVGRALLTDAGLIAFCHEHNVDVLSTPFWKLKFAATDEHVTVRSTDPWEVALEVTFDDETLELVVDGDLNIIERNRPRTTGNVHQSLLDEVVLPGKADCLEYIRRRRWPDGVTCPSCESADTIKKGSTSQGAKRYKCNTCDSWFNDLTGTVFAEHHLSLPEMFYIIQEMGSRETTQIAHQLDRSHQTVMDFAQKVKEANDTGGFSL